MHGVSQAECRNKWPGKARVSGTAMAKTTKSPSAVIWAVYKLTPEGLIYSTARAARGVAS